MDREKLKKIIVIVLIILFIILLLLLLFFWLRKPKPVETPPQNTNVVANVEQLPPPSAERMQDEKSYPLGLKQLVLAFAERFASYSTDADFKNFSDLEPLSTDRMIAYMADFVKNTAIGADGFEAVEAKALNSKSIISSETNATVDVSLQLTKYLKDKQNPETTYGRIQIKCVKVNGEWKVDEAVWQ